MAAAVVTMAAAIRSSEAAETAVVEDTVEDKDSTVTKPTPLNALTIGMFAPIVADDHVRDVVELLLIYSDTADAVLTCYLGSFYHSATKQRLSLSTGIRPSIVSIDIAAIGGADFSDRVQQPLFRYVHDTVMQPRYRNEKERTISSPSSSSAALPMLTYERRALVKLTYDSLTDKSVRVCVTHDRRDMTGFLSSQYVRTVSIADYVSTAPDSLDFRFALTSNQRRPYPRPRTEWECTSAQLLDQHSYAYHHWTLKLTQVNAFEGADALSQLMSDSSDGETFYTIELLWNEPSLISQQAQLIARADGGPGIDCRHIVRPNANTQPHRRSH